MSDHGLNAYMLVAWRFSLTLFGGGPGRRRGRGEGARPHYHQEGGREEKEQKGQPDQAPLLWWSWPFHLAVRLSLRVGQ